MDRLVFVTGNQQKVIETQAILNVPLEIANIDLDEIQETDLNKVAVHKLKQAFDLVKKPVIIDDVGLYINVWNNFPGPLVKWILKSDGGSANLLLRMLEGESDRSAYAKLIIGYHDGQNEHYFEGKVNGTIAGSIRGNNGFGWDPVFIPNGSSKTYAEMDPNEKAKVSHRGKALKKLSHHLQTINN